MKDQAEINRGYVDYIRNLNRAGAQLGRADVSPPPPKRVTLGERWEAFSSKRWWLDPAVRLSGLLITTALLQVWLRFYLLFSRAKPSRFTISAAECVDTFVEQYPFHLYPIVCKAFELACLEEELPKLLDKDALTLEIAIGDGSLSSRVFSKNANAEVIGLDLSPYSLKKASEKPHVIHAVVCDCLNPPVREGSFDLLIANNFLHHVTNKEQTLSRWSKIAAKAIFNENSPTWASGWTIPYLLKKFGRKEEAARHVEELSRVGYQCLEPKELLDARVANNYEITHCDSYMSERTFFYCGLFSFLMKCQGPPTPEKLKQLFLSKRLRWLVLPLTINLAKLLIRYDQHQDRSTDSFISYVCKSRNHIPTGSENCLACPNCRGELNQINRCQECGKEYSYTDGMLFLLPDELADLQHEYSFQISAALPKEHL